MKPNKFFITLSIIYCLFSTLLLPVSSNISEEYKFGSVDKRRLENMTNEGFPVNQTDIPAPVLNNTMPSLSPVKETPNPTDNSSLETTQEEPDKGDDNTSVQSDQSEPVESATSKFSFWSYLILIIGVLLPPLFVYFGVREYQRNNLNHRRHYPFVNTRISDIEVSDETKDSLAHS
ncbi:hypothetical protein Gasu2_66730 [Galdieria sulphuraria]|uniref:Uncharacterized protein n=1 Tax=Galdieria sulphuraria TaxID=130081 RepID=M2XTX1_GALSU|nr:uncharacterized protein Gasu_55310 [Galdieria sulphuraria]EME26844.1 hypothetical protein Gasu_55310 [Galdieria sulphuraria]GJD12598.1 hypothetical protein Gasu2_66730 [Galdieria sulphuraria]|eukprot:XP_005703364.1 hypothetical protein Gasu_55310 [Galdieria sulphuraria]